MRAHHHLSKLALSLLFPPRCVACSGLLPLERALRRLSNEREMLSWFCASCMRSVFALCDAPQDLCALCAAPMQPSQPCSSCACAPPPWSWSCAAVEYDGAGRKAIHRMKFSASREAVRALSKGLIGALQQTVPCGFRASLVPIPLHPSKLLARGYNPPELLAFEVGAAFGWPVYPHLLEKVSAHTLRNLSREERYARAVDLFAYRSGSVQPPKGRPVVLVDDVMTTTATLRGAALCLSGAGFVVSGVCAAARTL